MKEFGSFGDFAAHLLTLQLTETIALHHGLEKCARRVERDAKDEIGFYQDAAGPFPAWADLADSTEAEKARLGFEPDAPLLRTGELRDSIDHEVDGLEAIIGSMSDVAVYQELGTPSIPPRPFLGPAAIHSQEYIERTLGAAAVVGLLGGKVLPAELGYGFEKDD